MRWSPVLLAILSAAVAPALATSLDGIRALVERRLLKHADSFSFELVNGTADSFVVSNQQGGHGKIAVQCTSASACARGLYTYLTDVGGVDIWWTGSRLDQLPSTLPSLSAPINGSAIVPYRYHFNTVTFSYTTAFWSFDKWSLLLDWLALRGVNLPLAWVGYEYILSEVFRGVGLSDAEISTFFSGPAFQAWNRFGNIQGNWGGALPTRWITDQHALQQQIVARMAELGMTPVLPSFTGFVPRALAAHFPNASIVNGSQWAFFPSALTNVSFLEPFDPLFPKLQAAFVAAQQAAYGNVSHVYTLDQYNENDPFSGDTAYLANVTASTFAGLRAADPQAVWLMQGWLFYADSAFWTDERVEAYLGGVPGDDTMIILDLYSEAQPQWNRTSSYFGKQWVWCELHDYGGTMGLEGNLPLLTEAPISALHAPGSSMKGVGLTMEGQEGNEIVYDILLDQAWSSTPLNVSTYVEKWVARRYLVKPLPSAAQEAWSILSITVYNNTYPGVAATIKSIYEVAPALVGLANGTAFQPTLIPYDTNTTIVPALKLLVQAAHQNSALLAVPEFANDLVDISRQLLANRFIDAYGTLISVYNATTSTPEAVADAGAVLQTLLSTIDTLLYTNENFLLSTWIGDARQWAGASANASANATYAAYLEYNARNQITLWGPDGEINDYASKQWAGIVGTYYAPRWAAFVDYLAESKRAGTAYNATAVALQMLDIGNEWDSREWGSGEGETWGTKGDTWDVVNSVLKAWA